MATNLSAQSLYKHYDKGLTDGMYLYTSMRSFPPLRMLTSTHAEGPNKRECSQSFLNALLMDFAAVKVGCVLGDNELDYINATILQAVLTECDRLHRHQELFANEDIKKQFFSAIYRYSKEIIDIAKAAKESRSALSTLFEDNAKRRPASGKLSAKWNSFLQHDAAGSGLRVQVTSKDAYLQVIPEPGLKLLNVWSKEGKGMLELIEKASLVRPVTKIQR